MPSYKDTDVVIISGVRTPIGKFQGSLSELPATKLGALVVKEAVSRAKLDPAKVEECIMGNVVSAGLGQNPARQAAIYGGLPPEVGAMTINKVCGSGLKAVALGAQAIQTGNSDIVVAGGMESMTNAPYLLPQARKGYHLGNSQIVDSMIQDGLWDVFNNYHMGITGENVAEKYGITREMQDDFAVNSHRKAVSAIKECRFIEATFLDRRDRLAMRVHREVILHLAGDAVLLGHVLAGDAHVVVVEYVPESVLDHRIDNLRVAEVITLARLGKQIRSVGHRLHAACNHNVAIPSLNGLCTQGDCLESRTANLVDSHCANFGRQSAIDRRLARRVLT